MTTRLGRLLLFLGVATLLAGLVGVAQADIDPASDVLPLQNVFLPYKPKVCTELSDALRKLTATAKNNGYPVKVAVIGSKGDLGGAAYLFGKPDDYAQLLAQELATYAPDFGTAYGNTPILVAMPAGFGVINGGRGTKPEEIVNRVKIPAEAGPNELVRASLAAIPKLASGEGHPVATPVVASSCSKSGGGTSALIFIAPIAVLVLGGLLAGSRLRPRRGES